MEEKLVTKKKAENPIIEKRLKTHQSLFLLLLLLSLSNMPFICSFSLSLSLIDLSFAHSQQEQPSLV
jgi:hypothetical protein